jgi:hypothetical protein
MTADPCFPLRLANGLPFSCRERAAKTCQKSTDLAREAVGYSGVLCGVFIEQH